MGYLNYIPAAEEADLTKLAGFTAMARRAAKEALKYGRSLGAKKILDSSTAVLKYGPDTTTRIPIIRKLRMHKAVTPLVDDAGIFLGREAQRQQDNIMRMIGNRLNNPRPVDSVLRRTQLDNLKHKLHFTGGMG